MIYLFGYTINLDLKYPSKLVQQIRTNGSLVHSSNKFAKMMINSCRYWSIQSLVHVDL